MELTASKKFRFRFTFYFFIIYFFPNPYLYFPFYSLYPKWLKAPVDLINEVFGYVEKFWQQLIPWIGKHILHLKEDITVFTNGSGDTTYDYLKLFTILLLSFLLALLWWRIDKKINNYKKLNYWFTVSLRYFLAMMLFVYGFSKIFHLQMGTPSLYRLMETYGESSPMGITWAFLGLSKGYRFFIGFCEVSAGFFLLFRRTTLFGSLLSIMVMFNVFVINLCFDVPVKIFSFLLTLIGVYLAWPFLQKLYTFFFTSNGAIVEVEKQEIHKPKWKKTFTIMKVIVLIDLLIVNTYNEYKNTYEYGDNVPKKQLYGIYEPEYFIKNKDTIIPLATDSTRWKYIAFDIGDKENPSCHLRMMTNKVLRFAFEKDSVRKESFTLTNLKDSSFQYKFTYSKPDSSHLYFIGVMGKDSIKVLTKAKDLSKFLLTNTKFRWINEYPFNR